ncbi:hypothetical protein [Emticicia sp. 17c]|uniref:hypothetical protein n=1 Tax=Emticicia sp. 17c TaxID=3127704 RepID=UPI00301CE551
MVNGLKKYHLFLWIFLLSAGSQLFAHTHRITSAFSLLDNTGEEPTVACTQQNTSTPPDVIYSTPEKIGLLFGTREAEIEEEDNSDDDDDHHKTSDSGQSALLLGRQHSFNTFQASAFYNHSLSHFPNKLFMVFCVYII